MPLHQQYVGIAREVAAREGALLCDLAQRFDSLPPAQRHASFAADGIHLTLAGDRRAAAWLRECFEASCTDSAVAQLARWANLLPMKTQDPCGS